MKGKLPPDEISMYVLRVLRAPVYGQSCDLLFLRRDLKLVSGKKFSLIGTPIGQELKEMNGA